jgi:Cu-processing system permease protein
MSFPRVRPVALVAAREVRESLRSRWFVLAAGGFFVLSLGLCGLGVAGAEGAGLSGFDRTTASLLNLALLFIPLVTLCLGGLGFAGEIEDGALSLLLSQPLTRAEVFGGKLFGLLAAVWAAIGAGFGATGVIIGASSGSGSAEAFLALVGITLLLAAATLSLGAVLSVVLGSRARVIGAAFTVWLAVVYLCDLGTIGLAIARDLGPRQVFLLSLLNPVQQARLLGTLALSDRLDLLGPAGLYGLVLFGASGLAVVLASQLAFSAAVFTAAGYAAFRRTLLS